MKPNLTNANWYIICIITYDMQVQHLGKKTATRDKILVNTLHELALKIKKEAEIKCKWILETEWPVAEKKSDRNIIHTHLNTCARAHTHKHRWWIINTHALNHITCWIHQWCEDPVDFHLCCSLVLLHIAAKSKLCKELHSGSQCYSTRCPGGLTMKQV